MPKAAATVKARPEGAAGEIPRPPPKKADGAARGVIYFPAFV